MTERADGDPEAHRVADALVGTALCRTCLVEKTGLPEHAVRRVLEMVEATVVIGSALPCRVCGARSNTYGLGPPPG